MTTSKFSFNSNTTKSAPATNFGAKYQTGSTYQNVPSDKSYSFYLDLCKRKRVDVMPKSAFTRESMSSTIDALQQQPDKISDRQLEKVASIYDNLRKLGAEIKYFTEKELFAMTGGADGTASKYITFLLQKEANLNDIQPLTEEQQNVMVPWMLCPDVPFESLTIVRPEGSKLIEVNRTKPVEQMKAWSSDMPAPAGAWRLMTPDEFADELASKITKKDANALIDQYRGIFYDWKKTRITQRQIEHVRKIEQRMADMFVPKEVEQAFDWETGEEIIIKTVDSHVDRGESQYVGYTPIEEVELLQMSVQEASKYIDQLSWELECVKNGKMRLTEDGSLVHYIDPEVLINQDNQALTEKHSSFNERNHTGLATESTKDLVEITAFSDMLFSLEAIAGHKDEVLHELAKPEHIMNNNSDLLEYVAEFMYNTIDFSRQADYVMQQIGGLITVSENTVTGSIIAQAVSNRVIDELFGN